MLLFASIDVGSNTIRLLIGRIEENRVIDVYADRKTTRLGNKVEQTGKLQQENMDTSLQVLRDFASAIRRHGVAHTRAVATSALREASNSAHFIERVLNATGIPIEVIPGEKEAQFTLKGILSSIPGFEISPHEPEHNPTLIIDIGGGSSEWILYINKDHVQMGSLPVGVIKLAQKFLQTDPVSDSDMKALASGITPSLAGLRERVGHHISPRTRLIGTAGTFTTIASIDLGLDSYARQKVHLHTMPLAKLKDMQKSLVALPLDKRKKIRGLEPDRADLIIPGIQFTISIMDFFGFQHITISDHGLLEGVILDTRDGIGKSISETGKP